jgi:hypothetical protein
MRSLLLTALLAGLLLFLSGCFPLRIDAARAAGNEKSLRQHFFLLGLVGEAQVDVAEECPDGLAGIYERFTPADLLLGLVSVGIYVPRTVKLECAS